MFWEREFQGRREGDAVGVGVGKVVTLGPGWLVVLPLVSDNNFLFPTAQALWRPCHGPDRPGLFTSG